MILDPRLVPWADVIPGIAVSLVLSACGWAVARRMTWPAIAIFALAPVLGWALIIYQMSGALPRIPPVDAPLWALYFALAGSALACISPYWTPCRWSRWIVAGLLAAGLVAGIWFLIVGALHERYLTELSSAVWVALGISGAAVILTTVLAGRDYFNPAAWYTPWITGLFVASICLTLTGTARLGLFALGLTLTTLPAAFANLLIRRRDPPPVTPWMTWLPQVLALPPLMISGPLFASTPWHVTNLALAGVIGGMFTIYGVEVLFQRSVRLANFNALTRDAIAILAGMAVTAAPVIIPAKALIDAAAANGFPY